MKKLLQSKPAKGSLIICIILSLFFSIYGISRIDLAIKSKKTVHGTVTKYAWSASDTFNANDYVTFIVEDEFKVLMFADTHFNNSGWYAGKVWVNDFLNKRTYTEIKSMIDFTQPNLVVVAGDMVSNDFNDLIVKGFCNFMDKLELPWTFTFGNHDAEHRADKPAIMNVLESANYCILRQGPTNLQGLGNDIVVLKNKQGKIVYAFFTMDTGDWKKAEKENKPYSTFDVGYTEAQGDWYAWACEGLAQANGGQVVPSMIISHIPYKPYAYAAESGEFVVNAMPYDIENDGGYVTSYDKAYETDNSIKRFGPDAYQEFAENDLFWSKVLSAGSLNHMISGHNHCAGYSIEFEDIKFTSIPKTGSIYVKKEWDGGNRGGMVLCFNTQGENTSISPLYTTLGGKKVKNLTL